jgi:hypothetical protein
LLVLLPLLLRWSGSRYRPGTTTKLIAAEGRAPEDRGAGPGMHLHAMI